MKSTDLTMIELGGSYKQYTRVALLLIRHKQTVLPAACQAAMTT